MILHYSVTALSDTGTGWSTNHPTREEAIAYAQGCMVTSGSVIEVTILQVCTESVVHLVKRYRRD
jgi:hypothetical protein